ncbi:MAG TPA: hypothetical protein VIL99_04770 [Ignavibacteria bacterium]
MFKPLEQFICDSCGQIIEKPKDGWFEWISSSDNSSNMPIDSEFRICHHNSNCQIHSRRRGCSDVHLSDFLGHTGIINLLSMLDPGPYHAPDYHGPSVNNFREFTEIARRLTIPHYEEARQWWSDATNDGYFDDINEIAIYQPSYLKAMIEHYSKQ